MHLSCPALNFCCQFTGYGISSLHKVTPDLQLSKFTVMNKMTEKTAENSCGHLSKILQAKQCNFLWLASLSGTPCNYSVVSSQWCCGTLKSDKVVVIKPIFILLNYAKKNATSEWVQAFHVFLESKSWNLCMICSGSQSGHFPAWEFFVSKTDPTHFSCAP